LTMPKGNKKKGGEPNTSQSPPLAPTPATTSGVTLGGPKAKNPKNQNPNQNQNQNQKNNNPKPEIKKEKVVESDAITIETPGVKSQKTKALDTPSSPSSSFEFGSLKDIPAASDPTFESLPPRVQTRVRALQQLQQYHTDYEKAFIKELLIIETKYEALYAPLYEKRGQIVKGEYQPVKEDLEPEDQDSFVTPTDAEDKGIPEFWLTVLQRNEVVAEMITAKDIDALKHLIDVKYVNFDLKLRLEFTFSENDYFVDTLLVKTYYFEEDPETGEESGTKLEGTPINWKQEKNLTEKITKKKIKQKGKVKVVNKKEPCDSFFNFFNPKNVPEGLAEEDELTSEDGELVQLVEQDFEIGNIFKETLIPNAVKWFTGELSNEDDEDDENDFDEDEDEELDDDEDEDDEPVKPAKKHGASKPTKPTPTQPTNPEQPPECKQQ